MPFTKITSDGIGDNAVTASKIATGAVTVADIPDGEITAAKLHTTLDLSSKTITLPAEAVTAHVTQYDDNDLYINLALTNLQLATYANIVKYGLKDFIVDKFEDTSGVNSGTTTATRNASEYYWAGETVSYPTDTNALFVHQFESGNLNNVGTWGGTLTQSGGSYTSGLFNNAYNANGTQYLSFSNVTVSTSQDFTWEFWHKSTQSSISNACYVRSAWLAQGSNWNILFRQSTNDYPSNGACYPYAMMQVWHNSTSYSSNIYTGYSVIDGNWHHHALQHNASSNTFTYYVDGVNRGTNSAYGSTEKATDFAINMIYGQNSQSSEAPNQYFDSARFSNIKRYSSNFTSPTSAFATTTTVYTPNSSGVIDSTSTTATSVPSKANLIIMYQNATGTATVNTDIIGYVSRDGGTTYTTVTFSNAGTLGNNIVLAANDVDISSQPSGTSMKWKVAFANQSGSKQTRLYGVSLSWD